MNSKNYNEDENTLFKESLFKSYQKEYDKCLNPKDNQTLTKKKILKNQISNISEKPNLYEVIIESYIDLTKSASEIRNNFSKGHKHILKKEYPSLKYEIINYQNYKKDQVLEMMNLHKVVAGKITRSIETWKINEEMILNKMGFLIRVSENDNLISYSFIFYNKEDALYFSSCTLREKFSKFKNITHKSIWESINFLKNQNCKNFYLGVTKTLFSKKNIDQKRKNIERFKSSFGGNQNFFAVFEEVNHK